MDFLDVFALIVLLVLVLSVVAGSIVLGALPGRIAARRGHPQAAAINICGWLGLLTLGILWPIPLIWAYLRPVNRQVDVVVPPDSPSGASSSLVPTLKEVTPEL